MDHTYIAIDLKSFYASAECRRLQLDPLNTNLVVADQSRTEKTICLAVSPPLKALGVSGRPRLFEVVQKVAEINAARKLKAPGRRFRDKSYYEAELKADPSLEVDYVVAPPHMAHYMNVSASIYDIYLNYVAAEDIHVYSIDEVFIDVTHYLGTYRMTARELAMAMIRDVLSATGITATAGIGPNMFLCKVAMDIVAKHIPADKDGVRIAELDEMSFRRQLWSHTKLTDFWRIGHGTAAKLETFGMHTLGDVARMSLKNERLLYELFGVNAELLIDHAWGWEPCTMAQIKAYKPQNNSLSSGQVLPEPYDFEKGRLIAKEMADNLALDLLEKGLCTNNVSLYIGYDSKCPDGFDGPFGYDWYGRKTPKSVHGGVKLDEYTSSAVTITKAIMEIYDQIVDKRLWVRRVNIGAGGVVLEGYEQLCANEQLDLFTDYDALENEKRKKREQRDKEKRQMLAVLEIKKRFGKNALVRGMNLEEGAKTIDRNNQIGGHKA
ncbi:MAG: DNA methylase [Sphaerochaetaceae bacterium]|nr:DNA methylase [Sphaerochaetaceae bacterium]